VRPHHRGGYARVASRSPFLQLLSCCYPGIVLGLCRSPEFHSAGVGVNIPRPRYLLTARYVPSAGRYQGLSSGEQSGVPEGNGQMRRRRHKHIVSTYCAPYDATYLQRVKSVREQPGGTCRRLRLVMRDDCIFHTRQASSSIYEMFKNWPISYRLVTSITVHAYSPTYSIINACGYVLAGDSLRETRTRVSPRV
jgi:hypothetical protein